MFCSSIYRTQKLFKTYTPVKRVFLLYSSRSTVDAILALRLLSELHREFDRPLHVAYLDIKAAFDLVDRRALWKAMQSKGVPDILLDLIVALHENTGAQVRCGKNFVRSIPNHIWSEAGLYPCASTLLCRYRLDHGPHVP